MSRNKWEVMRFSLQSTGMPLSNSAALAVLDHLESVRTALAEAIGACIRCGGSGVEYSGKIRYVECVQCAPWRVLLAADAPGRGTP